jgi:hypothetical protein
LNIELSLWDSHLVEQSIDRSLRALQRNPASSLMKSGLLRCPSLGAPQRPTIGADDLGEQRGEQRDSTPFRDLSRAGSE